MKKTRLFLDSNGIAVQRPFSGNLLNPNVQSLSYWPLSDPLNSTLDKLFIGLSKWSRTSIFRAKRIYSLNTD